MVASTDRQARIDEAIDACTECGRYRFPKRPNCDGCTAAVDDEIAREGLATASEADRIMAIPRDTAVIPFMNTDPTLLQLLYLRAPLRMTEAEVREQRISWVIGQTGATREQVEAAINGD